MVNKFIQQEGSSGELDCLHLLVQLLLLFLDPLTWLSLLLTVFTIQKQKLGTTTITGPLCLAFIASSTLNEHHIQSVVGSQGIAFNRPYVLLTYSLGYPSNLASELL